MPLSRPTATPNLVPLHGVKGSSLRARMLLIATTLCLTIASALPALASTTTYALDSFSRSVTGGWGSAETGGQYFLGGPSSAFSVSSGAGRVNLPQGATRSAILESAVQRDVDIHLRFSIGKLPTTSSIWIYGVGRKTAAGDEYRAKLRIWPDGAVDVIATKVVGGTERPIGSAVRLANRLSAGSNWILEARLTGSAPTALSVRAWPASGSQPAWQYSATDSATNLQLAGAVGIRAYASSTAAGGPFPLAFDQYSVVAPGTTALAPTTSTKSYYVATTGSDSNAGTLAAPWRTLQKAADTVPTGSTVYLRGGTYGPFEMRRSGTASAPIRFTRYGTETAVVDGKKAVAYTIKILGASHIHVSDLTLRGGFANSYNGAGITAENSSYVEIRNNLIIDNKAWGVRSFNSTNVTIDNNEVTQNAVGIHIGRAGAGTKVTNNRVHHNNKMIVNTSNVSGDDAGGEGIALVMTTGAVTVSGNRIWTNRASSYDYGYDGGAFSVYGASKWTITDNVVWDNRTVLETGTDANKTPCDGNRFTRNVSYGATTADKSLGMVLRCASNTIVANNTFHGTQGFVFDISHNKGSWGASIGGLQIVNNIMSVSTGKIYGIETWPLPSSVVINHNLLHNAGTGHIATVVGKGGTSSFATFRSWTGYEASGLTGDPRFASASNRDYRLQGSSPAIDRGRTVSGITDGFKGAAPDMGRFEY